MNDKRVLLVIDESPYERERANVARRVERLIELLGAHGWEAGIVTVRGRWGWHDGLRARGVTADSLRTPSYRGLLFGTQRMARIARRERVAVIHGLGVVGALFVGLSRFASDGAVRIYDRSHVRGGFGVDLASRVAATLCDQIVAHSRAVAEAAVTFDKVKAESVKLVYGGIDSPRSVSQAEVDEIRRRFNIRSKAAIVAIVARLRPEKGHATLFEAARALAPRIDRPLQVVVVGAGPFESNIRLLLRDTEPFSVQLVGHQDDVAPWYALADIVAVPSYQDAFPRSVMEAMAAARPVVASRVGGLAEMIDDGKNGFLVRPADPGDLATALERVLTDESFARALGRAGRATYQTRFTLERRIEEWTRCYSSALNRFRSTHAG